MSLGIPIGSSADTAVTLLASKSNRHGLITGATGTGKTVTLQVLAEGFSAIGVPVLAVDIKGDLSGIAKAGSLSEKFSERLRKTNQKTPVFIAKPVCFWDIFGDRGHSFKTTVSELGPLLFARLLDLNEIQSGVLNIIFRVADDEGLLLLDLKDLRSLLNYVSEHAESFQKKYGNISASSVGAIQRSLLVLENQKADKFFGEPALSLSDFIQIDGRGHGVVNLLAAEELFNSPKLYSSVLLWVLSELFETLPEAGDLDKPKLVLFIDEAHLLFKDTEKVVLEQIEKVVRLIRSKGVGVYFVTQSPLDIPEEVLGQLGNRIQHALRAFTPQDSATVKAVAATMRANPAFSTAEVITELGVGEALVTCLDESGSPNIVQRVWICPPSASIGAINVSERQSIVQSSVYSSKYAKSIDHESAFEMLQKRIAEKQPEPAKISSNIEKQARPSTRQSAGEAFIKSTARNIGSELGRQLIRGILGSLTGRR